MRSPGTGVIGSHSKPGVLASGVLTPTPGQRMLAGLSLTGLSAAYVALSRPGSFRCVLCHTASFWWERGTLSTRIGEWPHSDTVFRVTVGNEETDTDTSGGVTIAYSMT